MASQHESVLAATAKTVAHAAGAKHAADGNAAAVPQSKRVRVLTDSLKLLQEDHDELKTKYDAALAKQQELEKELDKTTVTPAAAIAKESWRLNVVTLTGKRIAVQVLPSCTVKELKVMVRVAEDIREEHQRLVFKGVQLRDTVHATVKVPKTMAAAEMAVNEVFRDMSDGLEYFKMVLRAPPPVGVGADDTTATVLIHETLRFLSLMAHTDQTYKPYSPPRALDETWHVLMQCPALYAAICSKLVSYPHGVYNAEKANKTVDHDPLRALDDDVTREKRYVNTVLLYRKVYGMDPPVIWQQPLSMTYDSAITFTTPPKQVDVKLADHGVTDGATIDLILRITGC